MENSNFGPNVIYFALGITEGRPQVHPRRTPGRPQGDPKGPGTNPAPKGHRGGKNVDFSLVLIGKVDPGGCCRHRPGRIFGTTPDSLKPTRTLKL